MTFHANCPLEIGFGILCKLSPEEAFFSLGSVQLGFTGIHISFFYFFLKIIGCGYLLEPPRRDVLTSTHNLYFEQKYEKYQVFYLNVFSFWK